MLGHCGWHSEVRLAGADGGVGLPTSGAAFESNKTTLMHFIRDAQLKKMPHPLQALRVGTACVPPSSPTKVLWVTLDSQLTFKDHLAQAAHKACSDAAETPRSMARCGTATLPEHRALWVGLCGIVVVHPLPEQRYTYVHAKTIVPIERYAAKVTTNCFRTVSHEAACAGHALYRLHHGQRVKRGSSGPTSTPSERTSLVEISIP